MADPIILADNLFTAATPVASSTATGFDVANIIDTRPYTWWKGAAAGTVTITIDCGTARTADAIGIIGHNLGTAGATVTLQRSDNGTDWTNVLQFSPATDKALLKRFTSVSARYWRLSIATASVAALLAVVMVGSRLTFPFPPKSPFTPYIEKAAEENAISKTGNCLGTTVKYVSIEIKPEFTNLARTWLDTYFTPFWQAYGRIRKYHFWGWDLDTYPDQVFFVRQEGTFEAPVSVLAYVDKLKLDMVGVVE